MIGFVAAEGFLNPRSVTPGERGTWSAPQIQMNVFEARTASSTWPSAPTVHLRRPCRRSTSRSSHEFSALAFSGPQSDQHARDDLAVHLHFDAILRMTQQMTAAQEMFEKPKAAIGGVSSSRSPSDSDTATQ